MTASAARPPIVGNAAAGLTGLLNSLGIADAGTRGSVEDAIVEELAQLGFEAQVRDLRWGTLTLEATPQVATLLRYDQDNLLATLAERHPGAVSKLRIQVRRP